jgi:hypothetical protein
VTNGHRRDQLPTCHYIYQRELEVVQHGAGR